MMLGSILGNKPDMHSEGGGNTSREEVARKRKGNRPSLSPFTPAPCAAFVKLVTTLMESQRCSAVSTCLCDAAACPLPLRTSYVPTGQHGLQASCPWLVQIRLSICLTYSLVVYPMVYVLMEAWTTLDSQWQLVLSRSILVSKPQAVVSVLCDAHNAHAIFASILDY